MEKINFLSNKKLRTLLKILILSAVTIISFVIKIEIPTIIIVTYIAYSILFRFTRRSTMFTAVICLVGSAMSMLFDWQEMAKDLVTYSFFLIIIGLLLEAQFIGQTALIILVLTPLALIFGFTATAEQMAIYTYFLLVLTVITELQRSKSRL